MLISSAKALAKAGHQIVFVYTCRAESFYSASEGDFEALAVEMGCPFFSDIDVYSNIGKLAEIGADVCVSINWLSVLKDRFLDLFRYGVLNAHAGDLPRYKGNACPNWAILNFENKVALTVHKMTEELDSGPFLSKTYFSIDENTYITDIYNWLDEIVPKCFVEGVSKLESGGFIEQDNSIRTLRTYPRKPEDSRIVWNDSTRSILALIRASSKPFDGAFCYLNGTDKKIVIYRARRQFVDFDFCAVSGQVCFSINGNPVVATRDGLLEVEECMFLEHREIDARGEIVRSLRNRLT